MWHRIQCAEDNAADATCAQSKYARALCVLVPFALSRSITHFGARIPSVIVLEDFNCDNDELRRLAQRKSTSVKFELWIAECRKSAWDRTTRSRVDPVSVQRLILHL
jgi:hypothetical protein